MSIADWVLYRLQGESLSTRIRILSFLRDVFAVLYVIGVFMHEFSPKELWTQRMRYLSDQEEILAEWVEMYRDLQFHWDLVRMEDQVRGECDILAEQGVIDDPVLVYERNVEAAGLESLAHFGVLECMTYQLAS